MRVLVEALHVTAGIAVALLIAALSVWAYPLAHDDVWIVAGVAILCIAAMGIGPMRRAARADRAARNGATGKPGNG